MRFSKKSNILLILSILFFVISFIINWYGDELFDMLWVLMLVPYIILFILFVVLIILNIIQIFNKKEYINIIGIVFLLLSLIFLFFFPFREIKVKYEFNKYEKLRLEIVEKIADGDLEPDEYGNITLPDGYKRISNSGQVHVDLNDEEGQVIGFWVLRGIPDGSIRVVYSTGGEELIKEKQSYVYDVKKIKNNWYLVSAE